MAHDLAFRLLAEMRVDMYEKLDPLAPAYLVRRRSGDLVSIVGGDIETVEYFFAHTITPAFVAVLVPGAVLVTLGIIAWPLALVLAPFLLAVAVSPFFAQKRSERLGEELRDRMGETHAHMVDSIQGLREICAFGQGPARAADMVSQGWRFAHFQLRFLKERALQTGFIEGMTALGGAGRTCRRPLVQDTGRYFTAPIDPGGNSFCCRFCSHRGHRANHEAADGNPGGRPPVIRGP